MKHTACTRCGAGALHQLMSGLTSRAVISSLIVVLSTPLLGCASDEFVQAAARDQRQPSGDGGVQPTTCTVEGQVRCTGDVLETCAGGVWGTTQDCNGEGQVCSEALKSCSACDPGFPSCSQGNVHQCTPEGTIGEQLKVCPSGQCAGGVCSDPCSRAAASRSYIGCEYWPTVTLNAGLAEDFSFAVVVANPQAEPVDVSVNTLSSTIKKVSVPAEATETIALPWVDALKQKPTTGGLFPTPLPRKSVLAQGGAYRLESSLPVTVYQFNPLNYVLKDGDCKKGDPTPGDGQCNSYSNDASLLLPQHVLTKEYMVIARPTMMVTRDGLFGAASIGNPGFFAVVGTEAGETELNVEFSAKTQPGEGALKSYGAGEKASFRLKQWDVLQIASHVPDTCTPAKKEDGVEYCDLSKDTDLTGTMISANKSVAVFGGHDCTFVPFDKWACDHLEEQLFPTEALGRSYVAAHTLASGAEPSVYRVVSAEGANQISFSSPVHEDVTLERGQFIEFASGDDFAVKGSGRFALVQFMVGQGSESGAPGDPAMALAVPAEQYRTSYRFLAPESYEQNYVNVTAPADAKIQLDGTPVSGFTPIAGSNFVAAKVEISGGSHVISGSKRFGISVYGVGSFTSYMYPGGLDLNLLQ